MAQSAFRRKLTELRNRYGPAAADHFERNPTCSRCPETRLATLTVHHRQGKAVDDFETLCFNCHMVEHHGDATFADELERIERLAVKAEEREARNRRILAMREEGKSYREIACEIGCSHVLIWHVVKQPS